MPLRSIVLSAVSVFIGIAFTATLSTDVFARAPERTTRLHHHYHHYSGHHYYGQVRYPQTFATPPAIGVGRAASPYCWPYDYAYDPYEYCGASYIVSW